MKSYFAVFSSNKIWISAMLLLFLSIAIYFHAPERIIGQVEHEFFGVICRSGRIDYDCAKKAFVFRAVVCFEVMIMVRPCARSA